MSYLLLLRREIDQSLLTEALATMLSLPVTAIDVGEDGEDARNWAAPISCTVTHLDGDLPLHLDVYFNDNVTAPSEAAAAAWLAARLDTVVAYKSVPLPPSAHWLVGPDGQRTRARLLDEDENGDLLPTGRRIAAAESVVSGLPGIPVLAISEVIHEYHLRTPITNQLEKAVGPAVESVIGRLAYWESVVVRLASGWPPDGWYPPGFYRESLENRDSLAAAEQALPEPARTAFATALIEVDRLLAEATVDDGGQALASVTGPVPNRWWWRRITDPLPWHRMPRTISR